VVASAETFLLARQGGLEAPVRRTESIALRGRREPVTLYAIGPGEASLASA
jgi:class 3 adenylate cyclase